MEYIDQFLLHWLERFAQKFQIWTGKDCFFLSKTCLEVTISILFWEIVKAYVAKRYGEVPPYCLLIGVYACIIYNNERQQGNRIGFSNPLKIAPDYKFFRKALTIAWVVVTAKVGGIITTETWLIMTLLLAANYFQACDPLPPAKSRVRQIVENLFHALQPATSAAN